MLSSLNQMTSINSFKNPSLQPENKIEDNKPNSFSSNDSTHEANPKSRKHIFEKDSNSYEVYLILYEDKIKIKVNKIDISQKNNENIADDTISKEKKSVEEDKKEANLQMYLLQKKTLLPQLLLQKQIYLTVELLKWFNSLKRAQALR